MHSTRNSTHTQKETCFTSLTANCLLVQKLFERFVLQILKRNEIHRYARRDSYQKRTALHRINRAYYFNNVRNIIRAEKRIKMENYICTTERQREIDTERGKKRQICARKRAVAWVVELREKWMQRKKRTNERTILKSSTFWVNDTNINTFRSDLVCAMMFTFFLSVFVSVCCCDAFAPNTNSSLFQRANFNQLLSSRMRFASMTSNNNRQ